MRKLNFILLFLFVSFKGFTQNKVDFYNNTDKQITFCYAYWDKENNCWSTQGWFIVEKYSTETLDFGNYFNNIYIHGYSIIPGSFWTSDSKVTWGKDNIFCVNTKIAFDIRFADKINCDEKRQFLKFFVKHGKNTFTFNP